MAPLTLSSSIASLISLSLLLSAASAGPVFTGPIPATSNFTASNIRFVDSDGAFLSSDNGTFKASMHNPLSQQSNFYFCVLHSASNRVIWSANRDSAVSDTAALHLSPSGLSISSANATLVWSTPRLPRPVASMRLLETGNLVLLDSANTSLWQSFDHPTDTIVSGQSLRVGADLANSASETDFATGDYRFSVSVADAGLSWRGQRYWSLSTDQRAFRNSGADADVPRDKRNRPLPPRRGRARRGVEVDLPRSSSSLRIATLNHRGQFSVISSSGGADFVVEFTAPSLGLCLDGGSNGTSCGCPSGFVTSPSNGCVPSDKSVSLASNSSCSDTYTSLGGGIDYFANMFSVATTTGRGLSECQVLCSKNCSCSGFFYRSSSKSCFLLRDRPGSVFQSSASRASTVAGYIKIVQGGSPSNQTPDKGRKGGLPLIAQIILPCLAASALIIVFALGFLWWRRYHHAKHFKGRKNFYGHNASPSTVDDDKEDDEDSIAIPGLPARFTLAEMEEATEGFKTCIGTGGFGVVYKGVLPDKTPIAVKKIGGVGVHCKREFCTEIAVIGNIHHINLVKLKGYCAQRAQRLLVYEYMDRGSLDRSLFGAAGHPVLEWQERADIALGAARGLAYLHTGCDHKILHCDVKPENILLHGPSQVKISDFGLSKLLSPEQSNLFTTMRGTRGYLAPEWLTNSAISDRTDVYSYGMVLLEIVRGRKNCVKGSSEGESVSGSSNESGFIYFPMLALDLHEQGRYMELVDPRLEGRVKAKEVEKFVKVALCCVQEEPTARPSMACVVGMLEGTMEVREPRVELLNFLRFYGRRFVQEAPRTIAEVLGGRNPAMNANNNGCLSTTPTSSEGSPSLSYLSSQQVSGPR
ncbi:G-type lectin S-receptor-like serine/threonine-protein kinase [Acorus calamus]|uniref:Receptor-like serine/threonine-protein kinase n=1 Tax=Acorus calamus TaxID=4465 RepID=A0AAV9DJW6_ACOCL|nr:G-type lectin S-receptor-like serine/threonine-protein kinase [Acorus calamus]